MGLRDRVKKGVRSALRAGRGQDKNVVSQRRTAPREVRRVADARALHEVADSPAVTAPDVVAEPPPEPIPDVVAEAPPDVAAPAPEEPAPVGAVPEGVEAPAEEVAPPVSDSPAAESEVEYTITVLETQLELEFVFPCKPDEFILDAAERAGFAMPSSCRGGGCLVCAGRVEHGTYEMGEQYVLEDDQIADGFMLLCCSVPTSDGRYKSHQEDELD